MLRLPRVVFKEVQADRTFEVRWVYVHHVVVSLFRNAREDVDDVVSVRVDECNAVSIANILQHHVSQKHTLTGTGLTDDVEVAHAVLLRYMNDRFLAAVAVYAKPNAVLWKPGRRREFTALSLPKLWRYCGDLLWKVKHCCELTKREGQNFSWVRETK